jgi:hypothetical protein
MTAIDNCILDGYIPCKCVHVHGGGRRVVRWYDRDDMERLLVRGCILEAFHCGHTATHQCTNAHEEEE